MTQINEPKVSVVLRPAQQTISTGLQRVLFVGQKKTAGTAAPLTLIENIADDNSWNTLFGKDSMLAGMLRAARSINKETRFDAIALADASGTNATGSIKFAGTATAAGTFYVSIGSSVKHRYTVTVASGTGFAAIAGALEALIDADTEIPVTASLTTGDSANDTVSLEFDHDGTIGNDTGIRVEGTVAGITVTVTAFSSGATDPTLTSVFDAIGDSRYQTIVWPYSASTDPVIANLLDDRFNVDNNIQDGVAITYKHDSKSNILTYLNAYNTQSLVVFNDKLLSDSLFKGPAMLEWGYIKISRVAAFRSLKLTENSDLSDYVVTLAGTLDLRGGIHQASFPYHNTPLPGLPLIPTGKGFTASEVAEINAAGGSVLGNNRTNTGVLIGPVLTTYKTDSAGNPNTTYKFLEQVDTASQSREFIFNNIKSDLVQSRLTGGALIPGHSMINETSFIALLVKYFSILGGQGYVLAQSGEEALQYFKANASATVTVAAGRITATISMPLVTQAREFIVTQRLSFDI